MANRRVTYPRPGDKARTTSGKEMPILEVTDRGTVWVEDEGRTVALYPSHVKARKIVFIRKA